jgi:hypothetical protein
MAVLVAELQEMDLLEQESQDKVLVEERVQTQTVAEAVAQGQQVPRSMPEDMGEMGYLTLYLGLLLHTLAVEVEV